MSFNRRDFLKTTGLGFSLMSIPLASQNLFAEGQKKPAGIGMCDWNLGKAADPELIPRAKEAHLQGIQVSVGTDPDNIPLRNPAVRQIAPRAEDAGVALGLENTLSAKQNLEIIEQIGSKMAQVYYDLGNSTGYGYDVYNEIRLLGNERICEVHLKDWKTRMLGDKEGEVEFQKHAQVLAEIGYDKWLVLETSGRENKFIEDTRANVAFAKQVFSL